MKVRSKQVDAEAVQWDGTNYAEILELLGDEHSDLDIFDGTLKVWDPFLERDHPVPIGEWLVRRPCHDQSFTIWMSDLTFPEQFEQIT